MSWLTPLVTPLVPALAITGLVFGVIGLAVGVAHGAPFRVVGWSLASVFCGVYTLLLRWG